MNAAERLSVFTRSSSAAYTNRTLRDRDAEFRISNKEFRKCCASATILHSKFLIRNSKLNAAGLQPSTKGNARCPSLNRQVMTLAMIVAASGLTSLVSTLLIRGRVFSPADQLLLRPGA
jgi:hypothetical protein